MLPKDPIILLSFVNTQLRDNFSNLEALADHYGTCASDIENKLKTTGYHYDKKLNQFIGV